MSRDPSDFQVQAVYSQKKSNALTITLIVIGSLLLLCCLCCGGGFIWLMNQPEGGVRSGNSMEAYATDYINANQLLDPGENVVAYYDVTVSLSSKECAILTDQRLIYHAPGGNTSIDLKDITEITHYEDFGTVIVVKAVNGQSMTIVVAPLNNGMMFVDLLESQAELNGYQPDADAAGADVPSE